MAGAVWRRGPGSSEEHKRVRRLSGGQTDSSIQIPDFKISTVK